MHGPSNIELMIGADIQEQIGYYDALELPERVGNFADGPRGPKGKLASALFIINL